MVAGIGISDGVDQGYSGGGGSRMSPVTLMGQEAEPNKNDNQHGQNLLIPGNF